MRSVESDAADLLGAPLKNVRHLSGGDLSEIIRFEDDKGQILVAKNGPAPQTEAAMLSAMGAAGAPVPRVLASSDHVLVMTWMGPSFAMNWPALAQALCGLHSKSGTQYGWHEDYAFGSLMIRNTPNHSWPQFWGNCRVAPHLPTLPSAFAKRLETLITDLRNRLPDRPKASLLHGDLWSGNIVCGQDGRCALIDPACYYGDAEVDLAMLQVFDHPPTAFHENYGVILPDSADRLPIYQLWPALVHFRLFGSGYLAMLNSLLLKSGV